MSNIRTVLTPAMATYVMALLFRNTRTSCVSLALLCAHVSHDTLRRVLYQKVPWSRRLWDFCSQGLVQTGGYVVIDDTSWERSEERRVGRGGSRRSGSDVERHEG